MIATDATASMRIMIAVAAMVSRVRTVGRGRAWRTSRERFAATNRLKARDYSAEIMADRYLALYEALSQRTTSLVDAQHSAFP